MSRLQLHRLELQQTFTDSAILPVEVNKGRGLREWLHLNGSTGVETIAVGDSRADLAMFQAASRSFAPGHIGCRAAAQALGCKVVGATYQPGFLDIVRRIVHPDGHTCEQCRACEASHAEQQSLFLRMLGIADQARMKLAVRSVFHPSSLHVFRS